MPFDIPPHASTQGIPGFHPIIIKKPSNITGNTHVEPKIPIVNYFIYFIYNIFLRISKLINFVGKIGIEELIRRFLLYYKNIIANKKESANVINPITKELRKEIFKIYREDI